MKKKIVLVGGGGHCKVVMDAIKNFQKFSIYGIVDKNLPMGKLIGGVKVIGADDMLPKLFEKGIRNAFISIGSIDNCEVRKKIYAQLKKNKFQLPIVIHPKSIVAKGVEFGEGTFVAAGAVINPSVKIGNNVIINTSSSIDHDCKIGDFVHIAPGVTLCGSVTVGDETHIGVGANIVQNVKIGKRCIVGAGTTVRYDLKDGQKNF
jgi:UDP-perosamine 4-acetyltransferase